MKRVWIDGKHINDMASLHRLVSVALGFPSYYGNNLDALYDCLTDLFEKTEITVTNAEYLKKNLEKGETFLRVLKQAADENEEIKVDVFPGI